MTTRPDAVIDRITLIVSDLNRAEEDYARTFGCSVEHHPLTRVLSIPHTCGRRSLLRLGRERIELLEFTDSAGRPYPPDSTSTDLWFQHMAIVVNDMTHAHQRGHGEPAFPAISRNGPVRLPDNSGGVTAFKFRDHDGRPLELLAFPEGRVPGQWRAPPGTAPARFSASITPPSGSVTQPGRTPWYRSPHSARLPPHSHAAARLDRR